MTNLQQSDAENYICTATSASVFDVEAVSTWEIQKGGMMILENYYVLSYDDNRNLGIMSRAFCLNSDSFQSLRREKLLKFIQNARRIIP